MNLINKMTMTPRLLDAVVGQKYIPTPDFATCKIMIMNLLCLSLKILSVFTPTPAETAVLLEAF